MVSVTVAVFLKDWFLPEHDAMPCHNFKFFLLGRTPDTED